MTAADRWEQHGNVWTAHQSYWIAVTTNGSVRSDGCAVMGRGVAHEAKSHYPRLATDLGRKIKEHGNRPFLFTTYRIVTWPVKHEWREKADLELIEFSAQVIQHLLNSSDISRLYVPRPGCGNGGLDWADVKAALKVVLGDDERFYFITNERV